MDDKVTLRHPDYLATETLRTTYEDVCKGTAAVRKGETAYLPKFPGERDDDWTFRKDTATLLNITQKTVDTFCGLVFQRDISLDDKVPTEIAGTETETGLIENIDNKGNHLNVFARDIFEKSFSGCAGIFIDAPTGKANDKAQEKAMGLRPYWVAYDACDITNWDFQIDPDSQKMVLSLVVLRERRTERDGQFKRMNKVQYRVLMLENNKPVWQLWTQAKDSPNDVKEERKKYELTQNGSFAKLDQIPFVFIGMPGDEPWLMDLTYKNIEHFQTYSDYKSIIHKTCVPMLWTAGLDGDAPKAIGGSSWWKLTENGQMGFAEVQGTSIEKTRTSLEDIKADMAWLGLQMLMPKPKGGKATATEVVSDQIQDTSALQVRATQLKDALENALMFTAQYMGQKEGGSVELGARWTDLVLTPEEIQAYSGLVDSGQMSLESFLWIMQKAGKLPPDVDPETEMKRIDEEMKDQAPIKPVINAQQLPNEKVQAAQAPPTA